MNLLKGALLSIVIASSSAITAQAQVIISGGISVGTKSGHTTVRTSRSRSHGKAVRGRGHRRGGRVVRSRIYVAPAPIFDYSCTSKLIIEQGKLIEYFNGQSSMGYSLACVDAMTTCNSYRSDYFSGQEYTRCYLKNERVKIYDCSIELHEQRGDFVRMVRSQSIFSESRACANAMNECKIQVSRSARSGRYCIQ